MPLVPRCSVRTVLKVGWSESICWLLLAAASSNIGIAYQPPFVASPTFMKKQHNVMSHPLDLNTKSPHPRPPSRHLGRPNCFRTCREIPRWHGCANSVRGTTWRRGRGDFDLGMFVQGGRNIKTWTLLVLGITGTSQPVKGTTSKSG